jgi:hypothetical protein
MLIYFCRKGMCNSHNCDLHDSIGSVIAISMGLFITSFCVSGTIFIVYHTYKEIFPDKDIFSDK